MSIATFLADLDDYRLTLACSIKKDNAELDGPTLTEVTQRILDRLVFIRFLEDKQIEPRFLVSEFGSKGSAWRDFINTSKRLDGIYNGIVYKNHALIDSARFCVDEVVFKTICEKLCHLNSRYLFSTIPIHILGSIYERFLGKIIVVKGKTATIEEKYEVRHSGGVYYTPEYIVRYIVDQVMDPLLKGASIQNVKNLKFVDLACGSGSFLLVLFDKLIKHYTNYYNRYPKQSQGWECVKIKGRLHLTLRKKRQILLDQIFGIDIDPQAVEVAQLALYLKLLEDETIGTARDYQLTFHEALLPSLTKNILCGNSILDRRAHTMQRDVFSESEERELNPMDFEARFPAIMKRGGFDGIVGNPPYVSVDTIPDEHKILYKSRYLTGKRFDLYQCFMEQAVKKLRPGGRSVAAPTAPDAGL